MNGPRAALCLLVAGALMGGGGMMLSAFSDDWEWTAAFLGLTCACVVMAVHCIRISGREIDEDEPEDPEGEPA